MAYLKSTTAYVYDRLNAPIGTKMVFNQTASPLGWTKVTSSNDVGLRLVSGTVGTGGTVAFATALASHTPTISVSNAAVTLSTAQTPSHTHINQSGHYWYYTGSQWASQNSGAGNNYGYNYTSYATTGAGGGSSHTHTNSASSSAVNLDVSYVDVIIATKA